MITDDLKIELEEICDQNDLTIDFDFKYPINVTVMKRMQLTFFTETPKESYLRFQFTIDHIDFDFVGDFRLDDKLFSKLFTKVKKLHYIYLQEWYEQKENRFKNCVKSMWHISNGDYVAIVKSHYRG